MCASCLGHYNKVCYIPNIDMMHRMKLSRFLLFFPLKKRKKGKTFEISPKPKQKKREYQYDYIPYQGMII